MKRFLLIGIMLLALCVVSANAKELQINARVGGELNADLGFNSLNGAADVDLIIEKFPFDIVDKVLNFGKFSIKPYFGLRCLPVTYAFNSVADRKLFFDFLGDFYWGWDFEYQVNEANKIFLGLERGYTARIKAGSKKEKCAAGIQYILGWYNYSNQIGLFGNYKFDVFQKTF